MSRKVGPLHAMSAEVENGVPATADPSSPASTSSPPPSPLTTTPKGLSRKEKRKGQLNNFITALLRALNEPILKGRGVFSIPE